MGSLLITVRCPEHGLERFRVKVVKRYNIAADEIKPKIRSRPSPGISCLYIGRRITNDEVEKYLIEQLRKQGLLENVVRVRFQL